MWPMSHALYPGLNNDRHDRPSTAESHKTWYGNNRRSYAASSTTSFHSDRRSLHSLSPRTDEPGEELGDLINRADRVLSVLSSNADDESQYNETRQSTRLKNDAGSSDKSMGRDHESVVDGEDHWQPVRPDETGSETDSSGHQVAPAGSYVRSLGPTTESIVSGSTINTTFVAPTSSDQSEGDTTFPQSRQSHHSVKAAPGLDMWKHGVPTPPIEAFTHQNTDQVLIPSACHLANNNGGGDVAETPSDQRTAAPSFSMAWSASEKKAESIRIKEIGSDNDSSHVPSKEGEHEKAGEQEDEGPRATQLSGMPLAFVTVALSAAVFLVAMDVNVIATAIPRITGEFRSLDHVGWYGSAFLMATCATQIPYGRIYSLFTAKWVFTSAILIFMLGSLIAGVSPNSPILILGRAVQGVGTSGILSGGLIIMSQVVPLRIRPVLTSIIGAMEGVAMISAPIIGGALTDNLHWRWCFYINLPIGGFVLLVVLVCMRSTKETRHQRAGMTVMQALYKLDILGASTLLPPIVCTLLALHFAGGEGRSWGDNDVILLFVLAFVLTCIFVYTQHINAAVAMLPFRIAKHRTVLAGFCFISCTSSALVVITYFLPLWFQTIKDTSAQQSGIGILPMLVAVIVGVLVSGALVSLIGYYTPFMLASSVLMPVGLGMLSTIGPETPRAALLAYPAIFGLGVGMGFQQPLIAIQAALPRKDIPTGTSVIVFGQTFGAAIMIAAGESVFQNRLVSNLANFLGITGINNHELLGNGPAALQNMVSLEHLPRLIEAVNASLTETFFVAVAMAALSAFGSIFMGWHSVKRPKCEEASAGGEAAQA